MAKKARKATTAPAKTTALPKFEGGIYVTGNATVIVGRDGVLYRVDPNAGTVRPVILQSAIWR